MIRNVQSGSFYIGSAVNLRGRWRSHLSHLRRGINSCAKLQSAWNHYGEAAFVFEIVEHVADPKDLISREQAYFDLLNPKYNICKIAGSALGVKHSEETKRKMAESHRGPKNRWYGITGAAHPCFGRPNTESQKQRMSRKHSGSGNPMFGVTPDHRKLTDEQVREIRILLSWGLKYRHLRGMYPVSALNVSQIKCGRAYRKVV